MTGTHRPRAVVLVTVDSLRADALGTGVAPAIERLHDRGTAFGSAFAHGNWTPFSFPAVLGADHVFAEGGTIGVGEPTLAERLAESGVATGGFNAGNGFLTANWGYDQGFDRYRSYLGSSRVLGSRYVTAHPTVQAWFRVLGTPLRRVVGRLQGTDVSPIENASKLHDVEDGATAFLREAEPPFFCWIHYMDLHTPYVPAPRHIRAVSDDRTGLVRLLRSQISAGLGQGVTESALDSLRTLYRAALRQVDESVDRLLGVLEERNLREETCVVLAGDHGEEFQEHGHLAHYPKLYDELVRVPLVVDSPDGGGARLDAPVGLDAIPATICDWFGVDGAEFVGESLLPTVDSGQPPVDDPVLSVTVRGDSVTEQPIPRSRSEGELIVSARTDRYTYIHHTESGRRELYDRRADPEELADIAGTQPATPVIERLRRSVERYLASLGEGTGTATQPDSAVERQLEALGYQ
jgi:arylsulfatase A-like enzyme